MKKSLICLLLASAAILGSCSTQNKDSLKALGAGDIIETFPPIDDTYTNEMTEIRTKVKERTTRPTEFERSSSYEDLIFYDTSDKAEELLAALPSPTVAIAAEELTQRVQARDTETGSWEVADVENDNLPFSKAIRVKVTELPKTPYSFQLSCGTEWLKNSLEDGHTVLIELYARALSGSGKLGVIIEQDGSNGTYNKLLSAELTLNSEWKKFYLPIQYDEGYPSLNFRFGYMVQEIEFGGFTIYDYGTEVGIRDFPISLGASAPSLAKDAEWRNDALERIEEVRKGPINVIVVDCWGTPLPNVKVDIEMYEHEFEWGMGVNQNFLHNTKAQDAVAKYFNSAVLENELKWTLYETDPERPKKIIELLNELGIGIVRGHCLVWDRNRRTNDTSVPADLPELYGDRAAMTERIRSHIEEIMTDMDGLITDWDVLNEACNNTTMQDIYGRELIKEWFDMALEYGGDTNLYYNDFMMSGQLFDLLDTMNETGVVYDGIGVQSHYSSPKDMNEIYDFYKKLASYGKDLKVTEFDFATGDELLQDEFTRDLMILTFSIEEFKGFYHWGLSGGDGNRYVCFDKNYNPRPALEQIEDLIYNKWMTRESTRTDGYGTAEVEGFYGSYKITATARGTKKTVYVDCHKGENNIVYIEIP